MKVYLTEGDMVEVLKNKVKYKYTFQEAEYVSFYFVNFLDGVTVVHLGSETENLGYCMTVVEFTERVNKWLNNHYNNGADNE